MSAAVVVSRAAHPSGRSSGRIAAWTALGPALILMTLIIVVPIGWLFWLSFMGADGPTLEHYRRILVNDGYHSSLATTLQMAAVVSAATAVLGYPLAYAMSRADGVLFRLMLLAVLLPLWTALLVRTLAWLVLLQRRGLLNETLLAWGVIEAPLQLVNNFLGTAIGIVHVMLPFLVLPLYASLKGVDRQVERAAASLGAGPWRVFVDVTFPHAVPGLLAGMLLVFIMTLGFFVMPALLGGGRVMMWSIKITANVTRYDDWGAASSMGVVLLMVTLMILGALRWLLGRRGVERWTASG